ncbi:TfoX/Sxy family protein [Luteimonas sp. SX5]|uniref:TfoX/Sxy family protein n=1 Tax=Luteimonas galliterrae TaxID=2940486 RepID=A0ABT0MH51_9GAMM|nr:TfoX/Sxy family protein [Luteimonas galliterrae]MCL1634203.1 TfoX/Sxy family protein [Luteimonas galliterrae]
MAAQDPFVAYLLELVSPLGGVAARRMFGGWGIYVDGAMIGLVAEEAFYLKTDGESRAAFEAAGSSPFVFEGRGRIVETSYWSVPEQALDAPDAMRPWAQRALDAARRKAAAKKPRRKRAS